MVRAAPSRSGVLRCIVSLHVGRNGGKPSRRTAPGASRTRALCSNGDEKMAAAALAKRTVPDASPADVAVELARWVVLDLELRALAARSAAEEIDAAIRPVVYGATQGDAAAATRLAELRSNAAQNRQTIADLEVGLTEARQRLDLAQAAARDADGEAVLAHARGLADQFVEQSQIIDAALGTIVGAYRARQRLAGEILATGCLHEAKYNRLECPTTMACALAVAGAAHILSPDSLTFSGTVFSISSLAAADAATLSGLAIEHRNSRSSF